MSEASQRVAIVTGGARGIGAGTARRLAADGLAVAVLDLKEGDCGATVDAITAAGGRALAVGADVSDAEQVKAAVDKVATELGPPAVLVNNAGVIRDNMLFKMTDDDWDTVLGVHLRGSFLMSRACQKHMVDQRFGRIVNLSSSSALGNRGQANYSAAKAGLQGFTKTLAIELGQFGITANAVAPGFIATDMTAATAARIGRRLRGLPEGGGEPDPGPPGRHARRRRARDLVPGQRGRRVRLRPGHLRGRRAAVLTGDTGLTERRAGPTDAAGLRGAGGRVPGRARPGANRPAGVPAGQVRRRAGLGALPGRPGRAGTAPFPAVGC